MSYSMSNDSDKDMAVSRWLSTIIDYPCHPPDPAASCVSENNMATTSIMPAKTASLSKGHSGPEEWDTCMRIHDLAQLSGCFCNMNSILDLVKHNLDDLCVIKDVAARLLTRNPELPGIEILAGIKATAGILTSAIEASTSETCEFIDMLSGMRQTMEGDLSTHRCTISSPPNAWNIALPSDDVFKEDGEVEKRNCPQTPHGLHYHDAVKDLCSPRIYMPRWESTALQPQSRRMVMSNLPADVTAAQVLTSIRCHGGVLSISLADNLYTSEHKSALVEFVYPEAAETMAPHFQNGKISFLDGNGRLHSVEAYVVPTPSYFHSEVNHSLLDRGCTRALCLPDFPQGAIWHLLRGIGIRSVSHVEVSGTSLIVEFISLFETGRAERFVRTGYMDVEYDAAKNGMCYIPDSSQGVHNHPGRVIEYIDPDVLEKTWAQAPYDTYGRRPAPNLEGKPGTITKDLEAAPEDILAEYFCVDPSHVWDYLEDRRCFEATAYKIIGSNITLTRHKWSWSISEQDNMKLLMANTLHDPEWAGEWDLYFKAKGLVNLRTWGEYGILAAHRRERAVEQGLAEGTVPACEKKCPAGCRELKRVPVPAYIRNYPRLRTVDDDED